MKRDTGAGNRAQRLARRFRLAARTLGITISAFFMTLFIGDAVLSIQEQGLAAVDIEVIFIIAPLALALAAFVIGWWRERTGGFMLLFSYPVISIAPSVHATFYGEGFKFYPSMWLFSLPFFITGALFIAADRLSLTSTSPGV